MTTATRPQGKLSKWVIKRNLHDLNETYRDYMTASAERRHEDAAALKINLDTLAGWFVGNFIALSCDSQSFKLRTEEVTR